MKKIVQKKLSVSKATVSNLSIPEQNQVRGGYITASCEPFCETDYNCTSGCPSVNPRYCKRTELC